MAKSVKPPFRSGICGHLRFQPSPCGQPASFTPVAASGESAAFSRDEVGGAFTKRPCRVLAIHARCGISRLEGRHQTGPATRATHSRKIGREGGAPKKLAAETEPPL